MYRGIYTPNYYEPQIIGTFDTKEEAIKACVDYKFGHFSCDKKEERRIGLQERGWCIIGYTSNELSIEEV